jgi:hypothetical protein
MKQFILCISVVAFMACNEGDSKQLKTETAKPTVTDTNKTKLNVDTSKKNGADPASNVVANTPAKATGKDVMYYYKKFADIDSEDSEIGVGPRTIIEKDIKGGIMSYKGSDNKLRIIKVWNKGTYDVIDYPGGVILMEGNKQFVPNITLEAQAFVKKVIDNRTARGGECDYSENALIMAGDRVSINLTCKDDANFKQTIGYVTIQNGKMIITEK